MYIYIGNSKGLLVPHTTTEEELKLLTNSLPDGVVVKRIEEKLSALGNIIACNDSVALLHPEADPVCYLYLLISFFYYYYCNYIFNLLSHSPSYRNVKLLYTISHFV